MRRVTLALLLALALALSCRRTCPAPAIVRTPVVVTPPSCIRLVGDPPAPPATEDDAAWVQYHVEMEAWAAKVQRSCR